MASLAGSLRDARNDEVTLLDLGEQFGGLVLRVE